MNYKQKHKRKLWKQALEAARRQYFDFVRGSLFKARTVFTLIK
jgi:hypothetical protein